MPTLARDPALRPAGDMLRPRLDRVLGRVARSFSGVFAMRDAVVNALYREKVTEWREVQPYWDDSSPLDPRVVSFLDHYVHDSRAWFKPFSDEPNDEAWRRAQQERMKELDTRDSRYREWAARRREYERLARGGTFMERLGASQALQAMNRNPIAWPKPVEGEDLAALQAWRGDPNDLPFEMSGREPWELFGYLRWRTIYEDRATWLARAGNAVEIFIDDRRQEARRARDEVLDRMQDAAKDAAGDAADAATRYLLRRIRDAIPRGVPTL